MGGQKQDQKVRNLTQNIQIIIVMALVTSSHFLDDDTSIDKGKPGVRCFQNHLHIENGIIHSTFELQTSFAQ